ncbi:MAG: DUF1565 domain-containing protein [Spirochaetaceae bacterium]|jgi:hypothetical protein|nr:DUF1565 domain-containing protein [Spirochaetaceae bacterium]
MAAIALLAAAFVFAGCNFGGKPEAGMHENSQQIENPNAITISPNKVSVEKNGNYSSFTVAPANSGVDWIIKDQSKYKPGTSFKKGVLHVAADETASSLTVFARLAANTSIKSNEVTVRIMTPVYKTLYVSSEGSDSTGTGTEASPFKTIGKALTAVADAYASDEDWPGKTAGNAYQAEIVLLDAVAAPPLTEISGTAGQYPPLILSAATVPEADAGNITLTGDGSLLTVGANVTLTLRDITLKGKTNNAALVKVTNGGHLVLEAGAVIKENKNTSSNGGGVYVAYSDSPGTFTMNGGTISGNTAVFQGSNGYYGGGGVYVKQGTFTKTGDSVIYGDTDNDHSPGSIENTATSGDGGSYGHAVKAIKENNQSVKRDSMAGADVDLSCDSFSSNGAWD